MALTSKAALIGTCLLTVGLAVYSLTGSSTAGDSSERAGVTKTTVAADKSKTAPQTAQAKKQTPPATEPAAAPTLVDLSRAAEQKIRQAMQTKIDVTLKDVPLKDFVDLVAKSGKIPTWIDETALSEEGIATDEKLNDDLQGVTIEQALNWTLRPLGMTWCIEDGVLQVTTQVDAEEQLFTRTYDVHRLLNRDEETDSSWLVELIQQETPGPWTEIVGTGGTLTVWDDTLVVRQNWKLQEEIERLLAALEATVAGKRSERLVAVRPISYPFEADRNIKAALTSKVTFDFIDEPLQSVAEHFAKQHQIRVRIMRTALAEEGVETDEPVTLNLQEIALGSALRIMLKPLKLTYYISEGTLWITSEIKAEETLSTVVYNVGGLIAHSLDYELLIETIQQETTGPWIEFDGTGGTISDSEVCHALAIRQQAKVHQEITQLLADLRKTMSMRPAIKPLPKPDPDEIITQVYDLSKMNAAADLLTAIPRFVEAAAWDQKNKKVAIHKVGESLVVRQTRAMHAKIERFLQQFGYFPRSGFGMGSQ